MKDKFLNLKDVLSGFSGNESQTIAKFLISLDKNEIDRKYYDSLENTLVVLLANSFDEKTEKALDELLDYIRDNK